MKKIKIAYIGMHGEFDYHRCQLYKTLCKHYEVSVVEPSEAEYLFCNIFGNKYEYCKYPQIRIMYVAENYLPDLNLVDYAISTYPISLVDRCFYYPMYAQAHNNASVIASHKRPLTKNDLQGKIYFANFISGHESEYKMRGRFFQKLSEYKRVEAPGKYLNNMPNGEIVDWENSSKTDFQRKCKFTLCFESTKSEGFVTEKIMDAFYADTIPIYYGSDTVKDIFNEKAFINVADYPDFDAVMERVKELDGDDEKYLEVVNQPVFVDEAREIAIDKGLEDFLCHIIDQPYEEAYRRSRVYSPKAYENFLVEATALVQKKEKRRRILSAPIRLIKKIFRKKK